MLRSCVVLCGVAVWVNTTLAAEPDYPIQPVPFTQVKLQGGFWARRIETNRHVTVRDVFRKCEQTGRIDNFAVAGGLKKPRRFQGIYFNDSDVFKAIEGAAYTLAAHPDPELERYVDSIIDKIAAAQEPDGYLYTARTINDPRYNYPGREGRWSHLGHGHELYNVGHLYEAAVAYWQATGKRKLLQVALKNADLVCRVFGPGPDQRKDVPGHEEIEIGLVKLYRATGDPKYLRQAQFFVDMRGRADLRGKLYGPYCQDHKPVVQQREAVGHAVRAGYLYAAVADLAALTGRQDYRRAIDAIWRDIVTGRMYLTGGVGARRSGEAFGDRYELPNETAYNETCAAIAQALFNHRMFLLHGDARYIDVLERILYNGFLVGVGLDGRHYFYPNPLACDGRTPFNQGVLGRSPWFSCACCPVNIVRFVPSVPGMVYAVRDDVLYVNLYDSGRAEIQLGGGKLRVEQKTRYPWDGRIELRLQPEQAAEFELRLRLPGWARGEVLPGDLYRFDPPGPSGYQVTVNGRPVEPPLEKGYLVLRRRWSPGDRVVLKLQMPVRRVWAHPEVRADRGRVAFQRGPIVYCLEAVDHQGRVSDLVVDPRVELRPEPRPEWFDGVVVLRGPGSRVVDDDQGRRRLEPVQLTAVPYYAWAHRRVGEMAVWIPTRADLVPRRPAPTLASRSRPSASHTWTSDTVTAINDQQEPKHSGDHSIVRHTWWPHRGTREWVQLEFPHPAKVQQVKLYWFDDTGRGQCRVPASWRLLYRRQGRWLPVENLTPYTVHKDRYNTVRFKPVVTDALRVEVQLQKNFSGGVLEWQVE